MHQAKINLQSSGSYSDYFLETGIPSHREPDGKYTPVNSHTDPDRYYPNMPYCRDKRTMPIRAMKQRLETNVRIAPTHRSYLLQQNKPEIINRLEEQVRLIQVLLLKIFPLPILNDLLQSGLIINVADFSYRHAQGFEYIQTGTGSYLDMFNTISLNLPFPYPILLTVTSLSNELINAALAQINARTTYNPAKLPKESLKRIHKQLKHAAEMGMARVKTLAELMQSKEPLLELSNSSRGFLRQYYRLLSFQYQVHHNPLTLKINPIRLQQTGELRITGQTWDFELHPGNLIDFPPGNYTFPQVLYDDKQPSNSRSEIIIFAHLQGTELSNFGGDEIKRKSRTFPLELGGAVSRHGDILSIPKGQLTLQQSLWLYEEFFSGVQEFGGMNQLLFPEYCKFMSKMYCMPGKTFCSTPQNLSEVLLTTADEPDDIKDSQTNAASQTVIPFGQSIGRIFSAIFSSARTIWVLGALLTQPQPRNPINSSVKLSLVGPDTLFGANNSSTSAPQLAFNHTELGFR